MDYVTAGELAKILGVSAKTIKRRIQSGTIDGQIRQGEHGQEYCVSKKEVDRLTNKKDASAVSNTPDKSPTVQESIMKDMEIIPKEHFTVLQNMIDNQMYLKMQNNIVQSKLNAIESKLNELIDKEKQPWWKRLLK